jgi:hypothetical protein
MIGQNTRVIGIKDFIKKKIAKNQLATLIFDL